MLKHELLSDKGVLVARPEGPLSAKDFSGLAADADAYIESHGALKGLLVCAGVSRMGKHRRCDLAF